MISIKQFVVNPFQENTFILYDDTKECVIIDAGVYSNEEKEEIKSFIENNDLKPVKLLNTHCHVDHILGNSFISRTYNIQSWAHEMDAIILSSAKEHGKIYGFEVEEPPAIENIINDGDTITFGNSKLKALHVPGHSAGSISYYSDSDKFVIAGDALFKGSIGRTDLPGGDYDTLISSIKNKLLTLPGDTVVYSGHGLSSTVEEEKNTNPFLKE